jgi:ribosomal protein L11 methyltransferase
MTVLLTAMMSETLARTLADVLMEGEHHLAIAAAGAFEQAPPDWRFEAWFEEAPDLGEFTATVHRILGSAADGIVFDQKLIPSTDWVAKGEEDLPPVRAGRFIVHGHHARPLLRPNDLGIEIEASVAFGTGHHGTTAGCLLELDAWAKRRAALHKKGARGARPLTALDIGTGTGVLAIALAKALACRVVAGDIDPDAVRIARENVILNGVSDRVRLVRAAGTRDPKITAEAPYPLVVANILMGPLLAIATDVARLTAPGGTVILSGLLAWQARTVEAGYRARGFSVARRRRMGDWATLVLVKGR